MQWSKISNSYFREILAFDLMGFRNLIDLQEEQYILFHKAIQASCVFEKGI